MRNRRNVRIRTGGWATLLATGGCLLIAGPVAGQVWKEFRTARQLGSFEAQHVEIAYGAGRLSVGPSASSLLYDVLIRYDGDRFLPIRSWSVENGISKLRVSLRSQNAESDENFGIELDKFDLDFDLEDLQRLDDASGRLELQLSPSVPTDLAIRVGAAESALDLGGLSITNLTVETGASDTELSFEQANAVAMESLVLHVGAASFRAWQLGNANFETFRFEGGVGEVTLDFTGDWERSATGGIKVGVGAIKLRVPQALGVRIQRRSFLTAFRAPGFVKQDGEYKSANWDQAEFTLDLELDAAFGAVSVEVVP
jgi:hypothetical protein